MSPYPGYISTSGLGCFPFARHYLGNRFYFLFLRVLRCFSSPGSPSIHYLFVYEYHTFHMVSFLIRISADQRLFASPRSFSQLITSFFGAWCQGIRLYALRSLIVFVRCWYALAYPLVLSSTKIAFVFYILTFVSLLYFALCSCQCPSLSPLATAYLY